MKKALRKAWHFIWEDNSILSWIANVILAFIIIKFLVYPGLGFLLDTQNPVVAVVSGSMEHNKQFDEWWSSKKAFYEPLNITEENLQFKNGFKKGDLMILKGRDPGKLNVGEVIVFRGGTRDPVIHRIISKKMVEDEYIFSTKGDNNEKQLPYEKSITQDQIIGKAFLRIPILGYVKIIFTEMIDLISGKR